MIIKRKNSVRISLRLFSQFWTIFLLLFTQMCFSQGAKLIVSKMALEDIGQSELTVYYQYIDLKEKNQKKESLTKLQLLKSQSKFSDTNGDEFIRVYNSFDSKELKPNDFQELMKLEGKDIYKKTLFKDFTKRTVTVQNKIAGLVFQYEENIPQLNWKITKEMKELIGYKCRKATINFRGRSFIAWYTDDIPVSDGPHIFNGLPGLILEIKDSKGEYTFVANQISKKTESVYKNIDTKIIKTERDSYRRADLNNHIDPGAALQGKIYTGEGKMMNTTGMKSMIYNPIELE